jgi:hypothetical protein
MALVCEVKPVSAFLSTNLSNKLESFQQLGDRIKRSLGWPLISLEIHQDQLFENIQIAIEMYSKYAGYTQEFLIFDSLLYEKNKGIRLDHLFTVSNSSYTQAQILAQSPPSPSMGFTAETPSAVYVVTTEVPTSVFASSSSLSSVFTINMDTFDIIDQTIYSSITSFNSGLSTYFTPTKQKTITKQSEPTTVSTFNNAFDYDIMDYRKVIDVVEFEEGSSNGVNTLFTLEQTLAQQTYFSYALGNFGFDLVSWYTVKEFIDTREKMLATRKDLSFDPRTQYMQMYPQPGTSRFYGVITCYVERPIRDLIKEQWVYKYASALCKIVIGRVRGKFTGVSLLGGGTLNTDLLNEGITERDTLEKMLLEGASPGMGDADPCYFFVG